MQQEIGKLAGEYKDYVVTLRRYFHAHPELSGAEVGTQRKIIAELAEMGLSPRAIAGTGVVAEITGAVPGKTVAIRADMDALPVQEENTVAYVSTVPGIMHACGHDGHMAMLLGVAKVLTGLRGRFAGRVRLLFQPSEEVSPGGAQALMKAGALDGVDSIIGAHLWNDAPVGTVGTNSGRMMAAPDEFSITIQGRGGHGSMPHQTVDPVLTGAQVVVALNTIVSRSIDPMETAVVSLGSFKAGETFNVIPSTAVLKGTVRTFDSKVRDHIFSRMEQIVQGLCAAAGAGFSFEKVQGCPPLINHPQIAQALREAAVETLGAEAVREAAPVMSAEDFACYLDKVPGAFLFVGCRNPRQGAVYPHHHPRFDLDEAALENGVRVMTLAALKLLAG